MSRWQRAVGVGYLLLLFSSWIWMSVRPPKEPPPGLGWEKISIPVDRKTTANLWYRRLGKSTPGKLPVLLVHGSPMDSVSFDALLRLLPQDREYLIPDLPGFGYSRNGFTDFSFPAHTEALRRLLDVEKLTSVHALAYSQGGGPVLRLVDAQPERFASLTMLSAIGVQEYELTGDYLLNHLLHGLQYAALQVLRWALPHFGKLDDFLLNTHYAQNFFQSDMRPLRGILERIKMPTLILHGEEDFLIPTAAPKEHFRLIPQSEIVWFSGGHGFLVMKPQVATGPLLDFWSKVENGHGITRVQAKPERIAAALVPFDMVHEMALVGSPLRVILILIALATLISEDLACIVAGLLASRGLISIPQAIAAALIGILVGDVLLYLLGRLGGKWLRQMTFFKKLVPETSLESARHWLGRDGWKAILGSRFLPGARLPMYVAAGVVRAPFLKILLWFGGASVLWTVPVVTLLALFSQQASGLLMGFGKWVFPGTLLAFFITWKLLRNLPRLFHHRGRRILLGKWRRLTCWEFWPMIWIYSVVGVAVFWMGLRRGCLTFFSAVNPAIPHGGLVGESKSAILEPLEASGAVARFLKLENPKNAIAVEAWQKTLPQPWPLVVKPDVGERGSGVVVVRDAAQLANELATRTSPTLVQEYVAGSEFGVFYIQRPEDERGFVFSVTIKEMTAVTGDGRSTLEDLILDDERAVCSQVLFCKRFKDQLELVVAAGKKFPLTEIGSHCRGALFLNGAELISPALEAEMDRIAKYLPGFYFGRFDLRCPDAVALREGRGLRILELNGLTSEATHIYQPGSSLRVGIATLIEQWRLAIEIGQTNARNGARVTSVAELWRICFPKKDLAYQGNNTKELESLTR